MSTQEALAPQGFAGTKRPQVDILSYPAFYLSK